MAAFKELKISRDADMNQVMKSFYRYGEELKFMFASMDDDNMSREYLDHVKERGELTRSISFDIDALQIKYTDLESDTETSLSQSAEKIDLLVERGTVVSTMLSRMELYGEHIDLKTGHVTIDANNMKLDKEGNVEFTGKITGGTININNRFIVDPEGHAYIDDKISVTLLNPTDSVTAGELEVYNDDDYVIAFGNKLTAGEAYISERLSCNKVRYTSDERKKKNIREITDAEQVVSGLQPVTFRFSQSGRRSIGFIAQEVYHLQETGEEEVPMIGRSGRYLNIPYSNYGALISGAIQDNQRRIDRLRDRIRERKKG